MPATLLCSNLRRNCFVSIMEANTYKRRWISLMFVRKNSGMYERYIQKSPWRNLQKEKQDEKSPLSNLQKEKQDKVLVGSALCSDLIEHADLPTFKNFAEMKHT